MERERERVDESEEALTEMERRRIDREGEED